MSKTNRVKAPQKRLKGQDLSQGAIYKPVAKQNVYIRGKRFRNRPAAQTVGTSAELY